MKNLLPIACLFFVGTLLFTAPAQAQYRLYKEKYGHLPYKFQRTDPYRPLHSIVASAITPGLGQIIADEPLRGLAFLAVDIVGIAAISTSFPYVWDSKPKLWANPDIANSIFISGYCIFVLNRIVAARDAGRVARVNSLAWRDKNHLSQLRLFPNSFVNNQNGSLVTGATLVWGF